MPSKNSVGCSWASPTKYNHFESIIKMHISITQAVLKKHPYYSKKYHYIDATAGSGEHQIKNMVIDGNPIIFLLAAEELQLKYDTDFIEKDDINLLSLKEMKPFVLLIFPILFIG